MDFCGLRGSLPPAAFDKRGEYRAYLGSIRAPWRR
jgi:hypothetical protein